MLCPLAIIWWGVFSFYTKDFEMFSFSIHIICYCTRFLFQVITENVPITVLTSVSLISAVVIPLVGVIFGCFRCKGKCGGELIEEDLETNPKKKRRLFTAAISVCSAVIMWVKTESFPQTLSWSNVWIGFQATRSCLLRSPLESVSVVSSF